MNVIKGLQHFRFPFVYYTVEHRYNDIGLYNTPSTTSDILWYQLILHC